MSEPEQGLFPMHPASKKPVVTYGWVWPCDQCGQFFSKRTVHKHIACQMRADAESAGMA